MCIVEFIQVLCTNLMALILRAWYKDAHTNEGKQKGRIQKTKCRHKDKPNKMKKNAIGNKTGQNLQTINSTRRRLKHNYAGLSAPSYYSRDSALHWNEVPFPAFWVGWMVGSLCSPWCSCTKVHQLARCCCARYESTGVFWRLLQSK